jgi:hypothetical protein
MAMALSATEVALGASVGLTVTASAPDGDALTYTFSRGTCLPSQPFQAQQTAEFGDDITLAPSSDRHAAKATVVMVTWATEAYSHPITLNLYQASAGGLTFDWNTDADVRHPRASGSGPQCFAAR